MPTNNRATTVFKDGSHQFTRERQLSGVQFRRFRTRLGPPVAPKAIAAQLARLMYRTLRCGMKFAEQGAEFCDAQHCKPHVIHLKRKAAQLGLQIIEVAPSA